MTVIAHHPVNSNPNSPICQTADKLRWMELGPRNNKPVTLAGCRIVLRYGVPPASADTVAALAGLVWREANDE